MSDEVPAEEFEPEYNKAAKMLAQQVDIPGFRRGKRRAALLSPRLGVATSSSRAINDNLDNYYQAAVAEAGIVPMSRP